jgi:hypothetical protein
LPYKICNIPMKTIKFSEKELGFIRQQYQVELEEAEEYVENLKNILKKIGNAEASASSEEVASEPKRRGRKPKAKLEVAAVEPAEKKRKPRRDKGVKRAKRAKNVPSIIKEKAMNETTTTPASAEGSEKSEETDKTASPKKKVKRHPKRRRGVFLTPMRKPL